MNQNITSKNTSINSTKLPAIYNKINWDKFQNIKMLDYGCGKFDNAKDYIENLNGKWFGYDPYNRTELENERVYKEWFNIIVCSNVLNVLSDTKIIYDVLHKIRLFASNNTAIFFTVYEGDKSGIGKLTKADCYQRNEKTIEYLKYIKDVFGDSFIVKNGVITNHPEYLK